jgi:hypothetical protein
MTKAQFPTLDVLTVACAVFRLNGYVKKHQHSEKTPNVTLLYNHFYNDDHITLTESDRQCAESVIDYLKGLSFKAIERELTGFEANVLKFVNANVVDSSNLGIAASLPQVYEQKLRQDEWTVREQSLSSSSEYVGKLQSRDQFQLVIENVRYISSSSSYLYCCSQSGSNIIKFFHEKELGEPGSQLDITAFVKAHQISTYHGGLETLVNRVKVGLDS